MNKKAILVTLILVGCATGTTLFDPSRKETVGEPELDRVNVITDGMQCDDFCRVSGQCNLRQRIAARGSKFSGCRVWLHDASLDSILRGIGAKR